MADQLDQQYGYEDGDTTSYDVNPDESQEEVGLTDVSARSRDSKSELAAGIMSVAKKIGINPLDLATAISYETNGTFDKWQAGPHTQYGQHRGLIQWGEPQARQYGVTKDSTITDQLNAVGKYLVDRGVRAGMGLLDVYSAINAGRVGLYNRSDANNGGAPGTVADKVRYQMGDHRKAAARLLNGIGQTYLAADGPSQVSPSFIPPELRGPRALSSGVGTATIGVPQVDPVIDTGSTAPLINPEIPDAVATALSQAVVPQKAPDATPSVAAQDQGIQLADTAPNIGLSSQPDTSVTPAIGLPDGPLPLPSKGLLSPGNIDLTKRPIVKNPDGTISTVRSISFGDGGKEILIPTVAADGSGILSDQDAIDQYRKSGQYLGMFDNPEDATAYALALHKQQEQMYVKPEPAGPPAAPISGPNGVLPQPTEVQQNPPQSFSDMLEQAMADTGNNAGTVLKDTGSGVQQFAGKAAGATAALPWQAAAAVRAAVPSLGPSVDKAESVGNLLKMGETARSSMEGIVGSDAPAQTPFQKTAGFFGKNFTPAGEYTVPLSLASAGADALGNLITAANASTVTKDESRKLLGFGPVEAIQPDPALLDHIAKGDNTLLIPRVTHTVMTPGGPAKLGEGELRTLGVMGALTLGAIFAPAVAGRIAKSTLGDKLFGLDGRIIKDAPTDVLAFSDRLDYVRTMDDRFAGLLRMADRLGVNSTALGALRDNFQMQTGGSARNLVNSAVSTGRMEAPTFQFKSKVPVAELAAAENADVVKYMHLRNTFDDILQQEAKVAKMPQAQQQAAGVVRVRGLDKAGVLQQINAMEKINPDLVDFSKAYRDNLDQMRQFQAKGQYATMTRDELNEARQVSQNKIYQKLPDANTQVAPASPSNTLSKEMQSAMIFRMENEAKGIYLDAMIQQNPKFAKEITAKELRENSNWQPKTVTIYRRGEPHHYVMDQFVADVLNTDPYALKGVLPNAVLMSKRAMEMTSTGLLAPWFAPVDQLRSWQIGKLTTGEGLKPPTFVGTMKAVPHQLYPQIAKAISTSLDRGSGGWLHSVLGPTTVNALSNRLAQAYDNSFYAMMEHAGSHHGSFLQYQTNVDNALTQAIKNVTPGFAKDFLSGYKKLLNSIHNSAAFDFAQKNYYSGRVTSLPKIAQLARNLTGDPTVGGAFFTKTPMNGRTPIRMEPNNKVLGFNAGPVAGAAADAAVKGYGFLTEFGREAIPWWNITTQGMKRIGQSYLENPAKFIGKTYLYQMAPAAALFMYSRALGNDPNGQSYSDYQMRRRSEYNGLMNWYIPIPGRPAEDGIEVPRFHELAPAAHMMEVALDHVVRSSVFHKGEDFAKTAFALVGVPYNPNPNDGAIFSDIEDAKAVGTQFVQAALMPASPAFYNAILGSVGVVAPEGPFGGDTYKKKTDPFDQMNGLNTNTELVIRALGTGIADVLGSGYNAYVRSPDAFHGLKAGVEESTKRAVSKTPLVRNMFNVLPPPSGNTRVSAELFKELRSIDQLASYFKKNDESMDDQGISIKPRSKTGGAIAEKFLGSGPPEQVAAQGQPDPTNPLYKMFMQEVYEKFKHDSTASGGIGFQSLMKRYGQYSANLKYLRNVDNGNAVLWQKYLDEEAPDQVQFLLDNNVDPTDIRSVKIFYETKRQEAAKMALFTIRAVEEDMSRRVGQPIKFTDLDPYGKGIGPMPPATVSPVLSSQ